MILTIQHMVYGINCRKRDELIKYLEKSYRNTRISTKNKQKAYNETVPTSFRNDWNKGLWLPSSVDVNEESIQYIVDKIAKFYQ